MKKRNKFLLIPLIILTLLMSTVLFGCDSGVPTPEDTKMWKVTFDYNYTGAPSASVVSVDDGKTVSQPTAPTRPKYEFKGWFTNAACTTDFVFTTAITANTQLYAGWKAEEVIADRTGITGLRFTNAVTEFVGTWNVAKVYAGGTTKDAAINAITIKIETKEDPSELVDEAAYTHNIVYNLTGFMTFGLDAINDILSVDGVKNYKGAADWDTFSMGKVAPYGEKYIQPGPAVMDFTEMRDYGLFLELVADITGIDTEKRTLIIGLNSDGQLLLGHSKVNLELPSVNGEWEYCLIFNKA